MNQKCTRSQNAFVTIMCSIPFDTFYAGFTEADNMQDPDSDMANRRLIKYLLERISNYNYNFEVLLFLFPLGQNKSICIISAGVC